MSKVIYTIQFNVPARGVELLSEAISMSAVRAPDAQILANLHEQMQEHLRTVRELEAQNGPA